MNKISYCSCILIDLLNFNFLNLILVFFSNYNLKKIIASIFLQTADSPIREIVVLEKSIINNVSKKNFFLLCTLTCSLHLSLCWWKFLKVKNSFPQFSHSKSLSLWSLCICSRRWEDNLKCFSQCGHFVESLQVRMCRL